METLKEITARVENGDYTPVEVYELYADFAEEKQFQFDCLLFARMRTIEREAQFAETGTWQRQGRYSQQYKWLHDCYAFLSQHRTCMEEETEQPQQEQAEQTEQVSYTSDLIMLFKGNVHLVDQLRNMGDDEKARAISQWSRQKSANGEMVIYPVTDNQASAYAKALEENGLLSNCNANTFRRKLTINL